MSLNLKNKDLELIAYSNFSKKDNLNIKLKSCFDIWHEIGNQKDVEVINLIRKDKINILFDLSGHTEKNRLSVFVSKPAPVQISWGGYPGSIGIPEIDYIIGDPYVTPQKENKYFTEKFITLPNIWICFTPPAFELKIEEPPVTKNKYITFGSFNNLSKINKSFFSRSSLYRRCNSKRISGNIRNTCNNDGKRFRNRSKRCKKINLYLKG